MQTNKAIGIAAGFAAVATGLYVLYQKLAKENGAGELDEITENTVLLSEENRETIRERIQVEFEGGFISVKIVAKILGGALVFGAPHYKNLVDKCRKERRRGDRDLMQYVEICEDFTDNVQDLVEKLQDEIITELGITSEVWDESITHYLQEGREDIMTMYASLPHKFRLSMKPIKELDLEEFKKILFRQIELYEQEVNNADEIKNYMRNAKRIYYMIQSRVDDALKREFGVEEEDNYGAMKKFNTEPEVKELFAKLRQVTSRIEAASRVMF